MANLNLSVIPGEAAVVSIATLFTALVDGQSVEQKAVLTQRFIDLTDPWHQIALSISSDAAGFVKTVLKLNPTTPVKS